MKKKSYLNVDYDKCLISKHIKLKSPVLGYSCCKDNNEILSIESYA